MRVALILLSLASFAGSSRAQDKLDIDRQLVDVLKTIHNRGADIYNAGDPESCLAYFQGCLTTARAVLGHRPLEQKFIDDQLAAAARLGAPTDQAFALHQAIAALRERLRPNTAKPFELILPPPREIEPPTLKEIIPAPKSGIPD
jgi:hypothetical protein